jgi:two-component system nitrate/nitrite response regulator NarL
MNPVQQTIRTLLIDDHALFRESVARALSTEADLEVEHCGSIRDALCLLDQHEFDLVLLDQDLGNERASEFLPAARQHGFNGKVVLVTAWVSDAEARRLLRQGICGILRKESPLEELTAGIRKVVAAGTLEPAPAAPVPDAHEVPAKPVFNERQRKVLRFVLEGLSNKEIAWRLQISESYVKAILQNLFQRTGVRTRGQLVRVIFEQYEDEF